MGVNRSYEYALYIPIGTNIMICVILEDAVLNELKGADISE